MTTSQTNVGCLTCNVGLGKPGKILQARLEYLQDKNGKEWLNKRCKAVWNAALLLRNGDVEQCRLVYQENSIAYNKHTMIPKGIEGVAVKQFVTAQRPSVLKRKAAVLRYYTSLKLDMVTDTQRKKALTAIGGTPTYSKVAAGLDGESWTDEVLSDRNFRPKSLVDLPLSGREIHAEHLKSTSKYYSRYRVPKELRSQPYSSMAMSFMTEPWVPQVLDPMVPCMEMRDIIRRDPWSQGNPQYYAGKITFLQEQGCKARVVCQPSAWLQLAFMPLHNRLMRIQEQLFPKESCVTSQSNGAYAMMELLSRNKPVFCTDLSSATDRFPRWFSEGVLKQLGLSEYAMALEEVCQQKFLCEEAPDGFVQYNTGQPMGLYGSFPLFHLSNMIVAWHSQRTAEWQMRIIERRELTTFADGTTFKVVGDDIIFSDYEVSRWYKKSMSDFGVQISESKSFQGSVGEFAGFVGLKTTNGVAVFRPYKVPEKGLNNSLQFLDAMGSKIRKLSPHWEKLFDDYECTISSRDIALEPIIPGEKDLQRNDAFRGDNQLMVNLCNCIASLSKDPLPDLSGNTKVNRIPLFRERWMFDFHGYNPDLLVQVEKEERKEPLRQAAKTLSKDPLMREVKDLKKGVVSTPTRLSPGAGKALQQKRPTSEQEVQEHAPSVVQTKPTNVPTPKNNSPMQIAKMAPSKEVLATLSLGDEIIQRKRGESSDDFLLPL